jgi:hypothetical protein
VLREVPLGGQACAHRPLALGDQGTQLLGDLPVQALGFDGLQGHGVARGV